MREEEWRDIPGFEGMYQVSNHGRVKSFHGKREKILNLSSDALGYLHVNLHRHATAHQLVAEIFLEKPEKNVEVNHKDGNKQNNMVENLEWVTHVENMLHAAKAGLLYHRKYKKELIDILNDSGDLIVQARTLKEAAIWIRENTKFKHASESCISLVCAGQEENAYGYIFKRPKQKK